MAASFGAINLGDDAVWSNQFEESATENTVKYTEDGRKFVFQKSKDSHREQIKLDFTDSWLEYSTLTALEAVKNSGTADTLTLVDGTVFDAILAGIDASPIIDYSEPANTDYYSVVLTFLQV